MTRKRSIELHRLADALLEDTLAAPDEEILAEFREIHGDPDSNAEEMRKLFENSVLIANKKRLLEAKAGVAAAQRSPATLVSIDIATARAKLRALTNAANVPQKVTLAARKEGELSDEDIIGIARDLIELGLLEISNVDPEAS